MTEVSFRCLLLGFLRDLCFRNLFLRSVMVRGAVWGGGAEPPKWHAQRYKPQEGRAAGLLFSLEVCDGHGVQGVWEQQAKPIKCDAQQTPPQY